MKNKLQGEFTKKQKIGHQSPYFTFVKDQFEIVIQGKGRDQFQCTCRGGNEGGGQVGSRDDGYFKVPLFGRGGRQRKKKQHGEQKRTRNEQSQCQKCDWVGWVLLVTATTQGGNMATIDSPKGSPACIVVENIC